MFVAAVNAEEASCSEGTERSTDGGEKEMVGGRRLWTEERRDLERRLLGGREGRGWVWLGEGRR